MTFSFDMFSLLIVVVFDFLLVNLLIVFHIFFGLFLHHLELSYNNSFLCLG